MAVRNGKVTDDWNFGDLKDTFDADSNPVTSSERGLRFLATIETLSEGLRAAILRAINAEETRDRLVADVVSEVVALTAKVNALNAHGYPDVPVLDLSPELEAELEAALADMNAAQERFEILPATGGTATFGEGTDK